jgi:hypothetical protein
MRCGTRDRKSVSIAVNRNRLFKAVSVSAAMPHGAMKRSSSTTMS